MTSNSAARLALDFKLAASNVVNAAAKTVTVTPLIGASAGPMDSKTVRIRGPLVSATVASTNNTIGSFVTGVTRFDFPVAEAGSLGISPTDVTTYVINGTAYTGAAGEPLGVCRLLARGRPPCTTIDSIEKSEDALPTTGFTRRDLLMRTAALLAVPPGYAAAPAAPRVGFAYVGTYTPNGGGIYLFRVDRASGALTQLQVVDDIRNPSWLAVNPAQSRLYAVSEIDNYEGTRTGAVVSYAIDAETLRLTRLGSVRSAGTTPAYVSVHPSGKFVFVANYGGGNVAVFPVAANGALSDASDVRPSVGARHRARAVDDPPGQFAVSDHDSPHLHMVAADPSGQFVIADDAGLDLTLVWRFDAQAGRLLPADVPFVPAPSGSAPRHFVFHPNGRVFYNLYEHDAKVAVYDYDGSKGALHHKQSISVLPPKFAGSNLSSEIQITADGRFLYVANRLHSGVSAFSVAQDGQLRAVSEVWAHSDSPRSIAIDPAGELLYSCNQKGDSITSFRINAVTGALQFTGRFEAVGSPAFMTILRRS